MRAQEATVRSVKEQGRFLSELSCSQHVASESSKSEQRFESVTANVKDLLARCQEAVDTHVVYADALQNARTWLSSAQERLGTCSDAFTDKHALLACKQKVQDMTSLTSVGIQKLKKLQEACDAAQVLTSSDGQEVMRLDSLALKGEVEVHARAVHKLKSDIGTVETWAHNFIFKTW